MAPSVNTHEIVAPLKTLYSELVNGIPESGGYILNRGDSGMLASFDKLSASAASASHAGGASIAAHASHLAYSLSLINRWAAGEKNPFQVADEAAAWTRTTVDSAGWKDLREQLRAECAAWERNLAIAREVDAVELTGLIGSVAHLAYHLGAIRQIDRATAGPPHKRPLK